MKMMKYSYENPRRLMDSMEHTDKLFEGVGGRTVESLFQLD